MKKNLFLLAIILGFSGLQANSTDHKFLIASLVDAIQETNINKFDDLITENIDKLPPATVSTLLQIANNHLFEKRDDAHHYRELRKDTFRYFVFSLIVIGVTHAHIQQQNSNPIINNPIVNIVRSGTTRPTDIQNNPIALGATLCAGAAFLDMMYYGILSVVNKWSLKKSQKIVRKLEHIAAQSLRENV